MKLGEQSRLARKYGVSRQYISQLKNRDAFNCVTCGKPRNLYCFRCDECQEKESRRQRKRNGHKKWRAADAEFIAGARLDVPYLLAVGNNLAELLYGCILELSYIQSVENCESGLCATPKGKNLIEEGMKVLGVKDLSAEWYQEWE